MIVTIISVLSVGKKKVTKTLIGFARVRKKQITELICNHSPSSDNPAALNKKEIPRPIWDLKSSLPDPLHLLYQQLSQAKTLQNSAESKPSGLGYGPGSWSGLEENANLSPLERKEMELREQASLYCFVGNNDCNLRNREEKCL